MPQQVFMANSALMLESVMPGCRANSIDNSDALHALDRRHFRLCSDAIRTNANWRLLWWCS
jgi:hypothetical protein